LLNDNTEDFCDLEMARQAMDFPDEIMLQQEQSPAYKSLHDAGLIVHAYRLKSSDHLDIVLGNSSAVANFSSRTIAYAGGLVVGGIVYDVLFNQFIVKDGCLRPGESSDGSFFFFGPGVHRVSRLFNSVGNEVSLLTQIIQNGNRTIVTVPQGNVGLAFDRGQPVLLAPGLHQWKSNTMKFSEMIDLSADVIRLGPFTLLTVDEGYAAITQDNGKQRILEGGATHMLTHRNWKFEKLISLKIHTDDIGPFRTTSADNVCLDTSATVSWRVQDPAVAALMAADTMVSGSNSADGKLSQSHEKPALQRDVLKQAMASLAATIGSIRYADEVHVSANEKVYLSEDLVDVCPTFVEEDKSVQPGKSGGVSEIFSMQQMVTAVKHANEICSQYGVNIVSINVISAIPLDKKLDEALSAGAVAAAVAQQAEVAAQGTARARIISAKSEAEAARINAQAAADSERIQADGKRQGAALLEESAVAVELAKLERAGQALGDKTTFFFGAGPSELPALLANPQTLALKNQLR